jgi:DNA-binding NarL/FixJ family response regulator
VIVHEPPAPPVAGGSSHARSRSAALAEGGAVTWGTCRHDAAGSGPRQIRVLVVDDHPLVRAALVECLSYEEDVLVVGECEDGSEVLASAARLLPDVVVMDLSMPVMDGLAATQALRAAHPEPRVVMHTAAGSEVRGKVAVAGAHALVPKGICPDELLGCLRALAVGCGCSPYFL